MLSIWKRRTDHTEPTRPTGPTDRTGRPRSRRRRGAVVVLFSGLVVLLLATVTFSVDIAWMQLVRTELRSSTDAAAKAGAEALARFQDEDAAARAAIAVAAKNTVAGRPLVLTAANIEFGHSSRQGNGRWKFQKNRTPHNAVRINAALVGDQAVGLFFAPVFGVHDYTPSQSAVASQLDREVVLVMDRSHSMCFDYSGIEFSYPDGNSGRRGGHRSGYDSPPHPTDSRWAGLVRGVETFLETAKDTAVPPRVSLVTFSSDTGSSSPAAETDVPFGGRGADNYDDVLGALADRGSEPMLGMTNISAGVDRAREILSGDEIRPLAKKVVIVFTDGQWNQGRDPVEAARDAYGEDIVIHTVTLLEGAEDGTMQDVAEITGGRNLHARTPGELEEAFRELALTLPVVLTE